MRASNSSPEQTTSSVGDASALADVRQLALEVIDWTSALRSIKADHVERLAGASRLPAIRVWERRPGEYCGIDGYHRWRLAYERCDRFVKALVHRYPDDSAGERIFEIECIRSNIRHGLPLSRAERDAALRRFWSRWGRSRERPAGETLDTVGVLFNLTRQRVHQILTAGEFEDERGFSDFGRFTAATRRMSTLLDDTALFQALLMERPSEVQTILAALQARIAVLLACPRFTDPVVASGSGVAATVRAGVGARHGRKESES